MDCSVVLSEAASISGVVLLSNQFWLSRLIWHWTWR
jgi:hypothetical protein